MPKSKVKAAVLERSRRSTAGKRMASLVGKAQENDDAFWSHSIWSESGGGYSDQRSRKRRREEDTLSSGSEDGSSGHDHDDSESDGEGSYRMSDEDPDMALDKFDSDFDESESDEDGGDEGAVEEEQELRAEERREAFTKRRKKRFSVASLKSSAGRELLKKKSGKMTKRGPMGEGWNEGLVLNEPSPPGGAVGAVAPSDTQPTNSESIGIAMAPASSSMLATAEVKPQHVLSKAALETDNGSRNRAIPWSTRNLRTGTALLPASSTKPAVKRKTARTSKEKKKASKKRQFTQEELILESIKSTEMESAKWLSARKRSKEEAARFEKAAAARQKKSSLHHQVSRFHSRRGCSNTLTFLDMDNLPEILSQRPALSRLASSEETSRASRSAPKRRQWAGTKPETVASAGATGSNRAPRCVITGKVALYRDPKTMLGYHDVESYNEIRHRLETEKLTNNDRGSNDRASAQRTASSDKATMVRPKPHIPSTMVATIKSNGPDSKLKVVVTQGGVPVSPPNTRIRLRILRAQPPSLAEGSQHHDNGDSTTQPVHGQSTQPIVKSQVLVNIGDSKRKEEVTTMEEVTTLRRANGKGTNGAKERTGERTTAPPVQVVSRNTADGTNDDLARDTDTTTSNEKAILKIKAN